MRKTFDQLVSEAAAVFEKHACKGIIVGLSGTDSVLSFLICEKAMNKAGRPDHVMAIHYGSHDGPFMKSLMPWLRTQVHRSALIVDERFGPREDGKRWGDMLDRSVLRMDGSYRSKDEQLWVIGTRNRTEDALGSYSNASVCVSYQPIISLWKSEVLEMCEALGVPRGIISRSYIADCGCGDLTQDTLAMEPKKVDQMLQLIESLGRFPDGIDTAFTHVEEAISTQIKAGAFKKRIPHRLDDGLTVINVNPLVIADNRKNGTNFPPLRVRLGRDGRDPKCCHTIEIGGPCRIIHDPKNPIPSGAHVWIETNAPVKAY